MSKRRRTHQIIDYAVVPVFGCEVKVTVNEIVTNAWLVCTVDGYAAASLNLVSYLADLGTYLIKES